MCYLVQYFQTAAACYNQKQDNHVIVTRENGKTGTVTDTVKSWKRLFSFEILRELEIVQQFLEN